MSKTPRGPGSYGIDHAYFDLMPLEIEDRMPRAPGAPEALQVPHDVDNSLFDALDELIDGGGVVFAS